MSKDTYYFQIAGFNFCIKFQNTERVYLKNKLKNEITDYLKGFIIPGKLANIDYRIDCIWIDDTWNIPDKQKTEYYVNFYKIISRNRIAFYYRNSIMQFQMVISTILLELLTTNNGFILHASASNVGGQADIFLGRSGAGKSTAIQLLNDKYPALADDMIIVRKDKKKYFFYQTPFFEKGHWINRSPAKYKIDRVFILRKAKYFKTAKINNKETIIKHILRGFEIRKDFFKRQMKSGIDFADKFQNFYYLYFKKEKAGLRKLIGERM